MDKIRVAKVCNWIIHGIVVLIAFIMGIIVAANGTVGAGIAMIFGGIFGGAISAFVCLLILDNFEEIRDIKRILGWVNAGNIAKEVKSANQELSNIKKELAEIKSIEIDVRKNTEKKKELKKVETKEEAIEVVEKKDETKLTTLQKLNNLYNQGIITEEEYEKLTENM